jgi:hypothetical protein
MYMMSSGSSLIKYDFHEASCAMPLYVTAFDHFNEHRNTLKMTTGSANLDSLIDSIQEGPTYFMEAIRCFLMD